jgi:hypothetical protein
MLSLLQPPLRGKLCALSSLCKYTTLNFIRSRSVKSGANKIDLQVLSHYLLQQAEPSEGWAQHAPPLSSAFSLGVQQTDLLFFGVQQEDAAGA